MLKSNVFYLFILFAIFAILLKYYLNLSLTSSENIDNNNNDFDNDVIVQTSTGTFRGQTLNELHKRVDQFLAIPYAEPPIGSLRFAKPVPIRSTNNDVIIDATKVGKSCIQNTVQNIGELLDGVTGQVDESEDCLVLNIWTANRINYQSNGHLQAVMFWIHGGALSLGSIFDHLYNGSLLATHDVLVVSTNYRLGQFGFLYGGTESAPGNVGFYDQLLALKWVHENIHLFGGDRDQITIFGESAGSWSVSAHILSPLSKGLFKRAILGSGALVFNKDRPILDASNGIEKSRQTANKLNCSEKYGDNWLDCLRDVDAKQLIETDENGGSLYITYPVFGTEFLPNLPKQVIDNKLFDINVDVMSGVTREEGVIMAVMQYHEIMDDLFDLQKFRTVVDKVNQVLHNIDTKKVSDLYTKTVDRKNASQLRRAFGEFYGDIFLKCPTYELARKIAETGGQSAVYFYQLNYQSKLLAPFGCDDSTICHGSDLDYIFGTPLRDQNAYTETDYDFSMDIMKMWTNFAKYGNPRSYWPKVLDSKTSDSKTFKVKLLHPNNMNQILEDPYKSTCDMIWKNYYF
ncbi:cholinesterase 1-like [Oppia nitens]|uniref:cholinesterase 1-like n=1 Tax=Oppia nitens TaxID=1686743 RepID=UPI0023DCC741|nr:cholinesterase 1-like [Oppia nitens]